jgi:uncharacterized coiled-coil DUF342 family protein
MQELKAIVSRLRNVLAEKQRKIETLETGIDNYLFSELINRKDDIDAFEDSCNEVHVSFFEKRQTIKNFEKDAKKIEERIAVVGK